MEQNFQTSFIPKKPMIEERQRPSRPVGFFLVVAIIALFTVLIASGGLYFYRSALRSGITKMENDLDLAKNRFEPERITQLQTLDKRLKASTEILGNHVVVSPIFSMLQDVTMKTVRYTKFTYELGSERDRRVTIKMSGVAVGYRSIALQSDIFAKSNLLIDPVFSNLTLDNSGNVVFDLEFSVNPNLVDYDQMIKGGTLSANTSAD
jgi:hypothetical protein